MDTTGIITHVDGRPVKDLESFLTAVAGKGDGDTVLLDEVSLQGKQRVLSVFNVRICGRISIVSTHQLLFSFYRGAVSPLSNP